MLAAPGPWHSDLPLSVSCLPTSNDAEWGRSLGSSRHALGCVSWKKASHPAAFCLLAASFSVPEQGLTLGPWQWKRQVPATGQVGKSLLLVLKVKRENQSKPKHL